MPSNITLVITDISRSKVQDYSIRVDFNVLIEGLTWKAYVCGSFESLDTGYCLYTQYPRDKDNSNMPIKMTIEQERFVWGAVSDGTLLKQCLAHTPTDKRKRSLELDLKYCSESQRKLKFTARKIELVKQILSCGSTQNSCSL